MINITNLNKTYDDKVVLSNITFQANKGEITGLIGPNGSGEINPNKNTIRVGVS